MPHDWLQTAFGNPDVEYRDVDVNALYMARPLHGVEHAG